MVVVATVLTVYGIETHEIYSIRRSYAELQQYLPFTVLKQDSDLPNHLRLLLLQQYLPFTVLKLKMTPMDLVVVIAGCNSTYRLRY